MHVTVSQSTVTTPRRPLHRLLAFIRPLASLTVRRFYIAASICAAIVLTLLLLASVAINSSLHRSHFSRSLGELELLAENLRNSPAQDPNAKAAEILRSYQATHLGVRVFLLSDKGIVVLPRQLAESKLAILVPRETIQRGIANGTGRILYGEDPENISNQVPIAVVPVTVGSSLRYLYATFEAPPIALDGILGGSQAPLFYLLASYLLIGTAICGTILFVALKRIRQVTLAVSGISHDIRGPLTSIQARLEDLLDDPCAGEKTPLALALKDTKVLGRMINDLHELSLLESRGTTIAKDSFAISELLSDAVASVAGRAQDRQIEILGDVSPSLPHVDGSISLLDRMIRNLLENSLRYTPAGGKIFVHAHDLERHVRVIVSDTGVGIDKQDLALAGKKFWRGPLTSSLADGTGLGLFIARRIAGLHGSDLKIVSTKGDGTAVFFELPSTPIPNRSRN